MNPRPKAPDHRDFKQLHAKMRLEFRRESGASDYPWNRGILLVVAWRERRHPQRLGVGRARACP